MSEEKDYFILGKDHQPIEVDLMTWAAWYEDISNRRIAQTLGPGWRLSSVCLGMDLGYGRGPPILFETMLFRDVPKEEEDCWRFETWNECAIFHARKAAELEGEKMSDDFRPKQD